MVELAKNLPVCVCVCVCVCVYKWKVRTAQFELFFFLLFLRQTPAGTILTLNLILSLKRARRRMNQDKREYSGERCLCFFKINKTKKRKGRCKNRRRNLKYFKIQVERLEEETRQEEIKWNRREEDERMKPGNLPVISWTRQKVEEEEDGVDKMEWKEWWEARELDNKDERKHLAFEEERLWKKKKKSGEIR